MGILFSQHIHHALVILRAHGPAGDQQNIVQLVDGDIDRGGHARVDLARSGSWISTVTVKFTAPPAGGTRRGNIADHAAVFLLGDGVKGQADRLVDLHPVDIHFGNCPHPPAGARGRRSGKRLCPRLTRSPVLTVHLGDRAGEGRGQAGQVERGLGRIDARLRGGMSSGFGPSLIRSQSCLAVSSWPWPGRAAI